MFTTYVTITLITILANAAVVVADLRRAEFVLANSTEVGVPPSRLPLLATLKTAGAAGLLLGLLGVPIVGVAAAAGLIVFFTGALITHVRAGVLYNLYFPGIYWMLATGSLAFAVAQ
jgi:DoxX-like family